MRPSQDPFSALRARSLRIATFQSIHSLLGWDLETYMPKAAIEARSSQLQLIAEISHKEFTSASYKKALSSLIDIETGVMQGDFSVEIQKAAKEWRRGYLQETKLSTSFVKKFASITSSALPVWDTAKKTGDFSLFAPHLRKIVTLCQKKASLLGYKEHPYDALLDLYEPGLTVSAVSSLFEELKTEIIALLKQIQPKPLPAPLTGEFPKQEQEKLGALALEWMGFSSSTTRLDLSSHPFCSGIHPLDVRMTTRIDLQSPFSNLYSVLHEGGHALYHLNLPMDYYGTPICEAISYGVDESQSRLWETMIGKSLPFCTFLHPTLQKLFPKQLEGVSATLLYQMINRVEASEIRVEADEVTYSLHIILRFEIEKALIEGSISVADIPSLWKEKMESYLGITPSSMGRGCLQDIHWAMGGFGYFPSYTLGNLFAASLFSTIKQAFPDWKQNILAGDFSFLRNWLIQHIHQKGKLFTSSELIQRVTGKPLTAKDYIAYLKEKHL